MRKAIYIFLSVVLFLFAVATIPLTAFLKHTAPAWARADGGYYYIESPLRMLGVAAGGLCWLLFVEAACDDA